MARRDSEPPFFFRRVWTGNTPMDETTVVRRTDDGTLLIETDVPQAEARRRFPDIPSTVCPFPDVSLLGDDEALVIYGRKIVTGDPHDDAYADRMEGRGQVFAECFSVRCVEGEVGTHPRATLTEISREEFEAARARGWS